jgi:hypothetical protein
MKGGRKEGRKEGRKDGRKEGRKTKNLLGDPVNSHTFVSFTSMSLTRLPW